MTLAFVDTSAWVALIMPDDPDHRRARNLFRNATRGTRFITSNLVLSETYTWLRYRDSHRAALTLEEMLRNSERVKLVRVAWVTPEVHERAWDIFRRFDDQVFSFCDCTSFVVARDEDVDFVFGFDNNFATMGFDLRPGAP